MKQGKNNYARALPPVQPMIPRSRAATAPALQPVVKPQPYKKPIPSQRELERKKQNMRLAQKKQVRAGKIAAVMVILLGFAVLSLLIARYAAISSLNIENEKMRKEIDSLQEQTSELDLELAKSSNILKIQERAAAAGMHFPEDGQIASVSIKDVNGPVLDNDSKETPTAPLQSDKVETIQNNTQLIDSGELFLRGTRIVGDDSVTGQESARNDAKVGDGSDTQTRDME